MKVSDLVHMVKENGNLIKDMAQEIRTQFMQQREAIRAEYADQIANLKTQMEAKQAEIDAATDEDAKAALTAELEALNDQLEAIGKEIADRVKELRSTFKEQIDALKEQRQSERKARIEEHKAKIAAFRDQFQKNRDKVREAIKKWQTEQENQ
jgi:gas vesicle protein